LSCNRKFTYIYRWSGVWVVIRWTSMIIEVHISLKSTYSANMLFPWLNVAYSNTEIVKCSDHKDLNDPNPT
jgi:hypothetical protein